MIAATGQTGDKGRRYVCGDLVAARSYKLAWTNQEDKLEGEIEDELKLDDKKNPLRPFSL